MILFFLEKGPKSIFDHAVPGHRKQLLTVFFKISQNSSESYLCNQMSDRRNNAVPLPFFHIFVLLNLN